MQTCTHMHTHARAHSCTRTLVARITESAACWSGAPTHGGWGPQTPGPVPLEQAGGPLPGVCSGESRAYTHPLVQPEAWAAACTVAAFEEARLETVSMPASGRGEAHPARGNGGCELGEAELHVSGADSSQKHGV